MTRRFNLRNVAIFSFIIKNGLKLTLIYLVKNVCFTEKKENQKSADFLNYMVVLSKPWSSFKNAEEYVITKIITELRVSVKLPDKNLIS